MTAWPGISAKKPPTFSLTYIPVSSLPVPPHREVCNASSHMSFCYHHYFVEVF